MRKNGHTEKGAWKASRGIPAFRRIVAVFSRSSGPQVEIFVMLQKRFAILICALALAACASPETRIRDNPDLYAKLTPEQQALVKKGQIALGMSQDAVMLALGKPNRITERTDAEGTQRVWHYTEYVDYGYGPAYYPVFYDPFFYPPFGPFYPAYAYPVQQERDRMRVVFKDNKVIAIEREMGY
jgi:outer membrane protein assembly factor BamE (lipoprotein component of BamABCDE complex)